MSDQERLENKNIEIEEIEVENDFEEFDTELEEEPDDADLDLVEKEEQQYDLNLINDGKVPVNNEYGLYLRDIRDFPLLTKEQERELTKRYRENKDQEAREQLINCNQRLVIAIATRCKISNTTLTIMDSIQHGNLGLFTAIEKFDYTKGYKFSTYATWWIKQAIYRGISEEGRPIRLPVHMDEFNRRIIKAQNALTIQLTREPTIEELAHYFNGQYTVEKLRERLRMIDDTSSVSLDTPVGDDKESSLGDFIALPNSVEDTKSSINLSDKREAIEEVLSMFPKMVVRIMSLRYGLEDGVAHTLEDIADIVFKEGYSKKLLTRERIRQIEEKTLEKIRSNPKRMAMLRELM